YAAGRASSPAGRILGMRRRADFPLTRSRRSARITGHPFAPRIAMSLRSLAVLLFAATTISAAEPPNYPEPGFPPRATYPPRTENLDITIHYRIRANREGRIEQFKALMAHLEKLGFKLSPREDADLDILDPNAEYLEGTIPAARVFEVLENPNVL